MMPVIDVLFLITSGVLLFVCTVLGLQVLASMLPGARVDSLSNEASVPSFVVIMPAHNEQDIIEDTVRRVLGCLGESGRLCVVADNCSDDTALLARSAGADVVERSDSDRRGKGYALAHGVASLAASPPEVVLVLDADCRPGSADALRLLAQAARKHQRPIQGIYDMLAPPGGGLKQRLAAFAWAFKGRVRAEGYRRLGLPCHLMGSGMAFPWSLLERIDLATGHIVEDLKLGLDCALLGKPPLYLPSAAVESDFPVNQEGNRSQRQRWEHGHLSMLTSDIPRLAAKAVLHRNGKLLAMCIDVCIPPLAFLGVLLVFNALLVSLLRAAGWVSPATFMVALSAVLVFGAAVVIGWWKVGRRWVSPVDLLMVPLYIASKIPIYLGFLLRKPVSWIRTRRD
jgi:cellulose synthase/poly-beta-1,6-N-acetylglucosamine synthase-like glycosyltransferase